MTLLKRPSLSLVYMLQVRSRAKNQADISHAELVEVENNFISSLPSQPAHLDQALMGSMAVSKELLRLQKQIFRSAIKGLEEEVILADWQIEHPAELLLSYALTAAACLILS